jgi:hypothetical protein
MRTSSSVAGVVQKTLRSPRRPCQTAPCPDRSRPRRRSRARAALMRRASGFAGACARSPSPSDRSGASCRGRDARRGARRRRRRLRRSRAGGRPARRQASRPPSESGPESPDHTRSRVPAAPCSGSELDVVDRDRRQPTRRGPRWGNDLHPVTICRRRLAQAKRARSGLRLRTTLLGSGLRRFTHPHA